MVFSGWQPVQTFGRITKNGRVPAHRVYHEHKAQSSDCAGPKHRTDSKSNPLSSFKSISSLQSRSGSESSSSFQSSFKYNRRSTLQIRHASMRRGCPQQILKDLTGGTRVPRSWVMIFIQALSTGTSRSTKKIKAVSLHTDAPSACIPRLLTAFPSRRSHLHPGTPEAQGAGSMPGQHQKLNPRNADIRIQDQSCRSDSTGTKRCMSRGGKEDKHAGEGTLAHKLLGFCGDGDDQSGLGAYVRATTTYHWTINVMIPTLVRLYF